MTGVRRAVRRRLGLYQIVAGRQVFRHPSQRERDYILDKLVDFHRQQGTPPDQTLADLYAAMEQVPRREHRHEATPLEERFARTQNRRRRREPQPIGEILLAVLAKLGVGTVDLTTEDRDAR